MRVDTRIVSLIKSIREEYGNVGKVKLQIMVEAYAQELGLQTPGKSAIGNIIRRNKYFFDRPRSPHRRRGSRCLRTRYAPKETTPGFVEIDCVIVYVNGERHTFVTVMDVVTKFACALHTRTPNSLSSVKALIKFQTLSPFLVRVIQSDNGSEFLGEFEKYCETNKIDHLFTYPRSPKINGGIERFNRTIQEEFVTRTDTLIGSVTILNEHLEKYLNWYNYQRPHQSLGYLTPSQYIQQLQSKM